jgi:hypothetical protein
MRGSITVYIAVPGAVHLAHPTRTNGREDFVGAYALAGVNCHWLLPIANEANYITFLEGLEGAVFREGAKFLLAESNHIL